MGASNAGSAIVIFDQYLALFEHPYQ